MVRNIEEKIAEQFVEADGRVMVLFFPALRGARRLTQAC